MEIAYRWYEITFVLKPEIRNIDKKTWYDLISITLYNTHYILESVQVLLDFNIKQNEKILFDHPYVAGGLYTHAVEEFGKYLYLKSLIKKNDNYKINYHEEFRNHSKKFKRALSYLPDECRLIHSKGFTDPVFTDFGPTEEVIANFETRKNIFYSDFKNKEIQPLPSVDVKLLQHAVKKFFEITKKELEKFYKDNS